MSLLQFELQQIKLGNNFIAGIDEVGRGPLAGPLVIAAVIFDKNKLLSLEQHLNRNNDVISDEFKLLLKINDSKKINEKTRIILSSFIKDFSISFSIIEIQHYDIDKKGIAWGTEQGFYRAYKELDIKPDHVLSDAYKIKSLPTDMQTNIIKGDSKSISIAAASIIAKVYRDDLMNKYDSLFPNYSFKKHKGYGTKQHLEAINKFGPCEIHRKSFKPIKKT